MTWLGWLFISVVLALLVLLACYLGSGGWGMIEAALCMFALGYVLGTLSVLLMFGLFGPKRGI